MGYTSTLPKPGDNKIVLLKKILQAWGGTIPNGPLHEREVLRLLLTHIGVTVPNGPHTSEELLALLLAAFNGGNCPECPDCPECPTVSSNALLAFIPPITELDGKNFDFSNDPLVGLAGALHVGSVTLVNTLNAPVGFGSLDTITELHFPNLATAEGGGDFTISSGTGLTKVSFPLLTFIDGTLLLDNNSALVTVELPSLASITSDFSIISSPVETLDLRALTGWFTATFTAEPTLVNVDLRSMTDDNVGQFQIDILGQAHPNLASLNLASLVTPSSDLDFSGLAALTTLNLDSLATAGNLDLANAGLTTISLPSLTSVDTINADGLAALTSMNLPALVTLTTELRGANSALLNSVNCPALVPTDGAAFQFSGCELDATSVNLILRRCALAGLTTSVIDLSGGQNAAPTGQGIIDAADLATAGCSVTTN